MEARERVATLSFSITWPCLQPEAVACSHEINSKKVRGEIKQQMPLLLFGSLGLNVETYHMSAYRPMRGGRMLSIVLAPTENKSGSQVTA